MLGLRRDQCSATRVPSEAIPHRLGRARSITLDDQVLALVRDSTSRSQLVPIPPGVEVTEPVGLSPVHFPDRADNSGFVGWLATHIKNTTGSGVFVVSGNNIDRGGIYDYWSYPIIVRNLIATTNGLRSSTP